MTNLSILRKHKSRENETVEHREIRCALQNILFRPFSFERLQCIKTKRLRERMTEEIRWSCEYNASDAPTVPVT
ncbi:unnamed protein product [Rhizophagus irregularis]|nr:unnamed protein product [Rhizophagus irregularis]